MEALSPVIFRIFKIEIILYIVPPEPPVASWSEDEQALMLEHLGVVLPYFEGTQLAAWAYNEALGAVYSTFSGDVTEVVLAALSEVRCVLFSALSCLPLSP